MSSKSQLMTLSGSDQTAELSEIDDLKNYDADKDAAASCGPQPDQFGCPRQSPDEVSEMSAACVHAGGVALETSVQKLHCKCEGAATSAREYRVCDLPICDWQLVHTVEGTEDTPSHESNLGIVLPSNYRRFALRSIPAAEITESNEGSIAVVGLLQSGRIVLAKFDSLRRVLADITKQLDVVKFARAISEMCAECHQCAEKNVTGELMARNFVSRMHECDEVPRPNFESIFCRICDVCFNHHLEENQRCLFLPAFRCVCNFKSFQARFVTGRGILALISLLHSCQSCMSAELVLECISILVPHSAQETITARLICPIVMESLFDLVDAHALAASKVITILEQWLLFKRGRKQVASSSVMIRLATQMMALRDIPVLSSSTRLLRSILDTESRNLLPFIQSPSFCLALSQASSSAVSVEPRITENVLFSFWKGLNLISLDKQGAISSDSMKELFLATALQLAQEYESSNKSASQILCAQSLCTVAQMFPTTIFLDHKENDRVLKNEEVKRIVLELMKDVVGLSDRSLGAVYFCSRLTSSLVGSLTGLREMTVDSAGVSTFESLVGVGTEMGVCVCPARQNLELLQKTKRRKTMLDQWAPMVSAEAVSIGADVCPMCLEPLINHQIIRQIRCPGNHVFCTECIENWLVYKQHGSCPICRHDCTI